MTNKNLFKIIIVAIILIAFTITFGKTYSKYLLTRHYETTLSSLPFYFEAQAEDYGFVYTSVLYDHASFSITISNNDGVNYNLFDTEYEISMEENDKFELSETNVLNNTIKGNSLVDDKINLTLNIKDKTNSLDTFTIIIKSTKPYTKEIRLNFRVFKANRIDYIEDLVELSVAVNQGNTFKGETFTLTRTLDFQNPADYRYPDQNNYGNVNNDSLTGTTLMEELNNTSGRGFPSIGNYIHHFQGSFNGNNNTLKNIYIHSYTNNNHPEYEVASFFGFITDATVKNFTITGDTFTDQTANIGGLASYASNVEIDNVHNYVNVTSYGTGYSVGGIIGSIGNDNINLRGDNIRLSGCSNHGTLQGGNHGGGLIGASSGSSHVYIDSSYNEGDVKNSIITDSGILGLSNGNTYISSSYNLGNISTNSKGNANGTISLGGMIAANYGASFVVNSYNKGNITYEGTGANGGSLAGLVGLIQGGTHVLNSYNQGNIKDNTSKNYVGGITNTVNWTTGAHQQVYNCYNTGTITGGYSRYQIGYLHDGDIKTSYYKSGNGQGSNKSGTTEISDANMKLDANNSNSLAYKLNDGRKNINLTNIQSDLVSHGYNTNYFTLSLSNWINDPETGYPTLEN